MAEAIHKMNAVHLKEWMLHPSPAPNSSFQTKWHTTFKNGRLQVAFWRKYIALTKFDSTPKEN